MGHLDRNKCICTDTLISDDHQSSPEVCLIIYKVEEQKADFLLVVLLFKH